MGPFYGSFGVMVKALAYMSVSYTHLDVYKRQHQVSFDIQAGGITVLAGRSGSGKTTLLRALNRLNETFPHCRTSGRVELDLGQGLEPVYPAPGAAVRSLAL